jgi:hypothetical protein
MDFEPCLPKSFIPKKITVNTPPTDTGVDIIIESVQESNYDLKHGSEQEQNSNHDSEQDSEHDEQDSEHDSDLDEQDSKKHDEQDSDHDSDLDEQDSDHDSDLDEQDSKKHDEQDSEHDSEPQEDSTQHEEKKEDDIDIDLSEKLDEQLNVEAEISKLVNTNTFKELRDLCKSKSLGLNGKKVELARRYVQSMMETDFIICT